jgi:hypothetical protein
MQAARVSQAKERDMHIPIQFLMHAQLKAHLVCGSRHRLLHRLRTPELGRATPDAAAQQQRGALLVLNGIRAAPVLR